MKEEDRRREEEERRREQLFRAIEQLIYTAYLQALSLPAVRRAIEQKKDDFFFESNHTANRQVERVLGVMADRLNGILLNGIRREWAFSQEVLEARVEAQLDPSTRDRMLRDRLRIDATQRSRLASADAFVREKQRDGLNLSGRVWNLAGNAKKEIEVILQNAIKEGRRGTEIAKDLRQFLIEPNKLFRRVRNKETGALELSAAAKAYHPGQGVYRSSYKNALRMARTELKAAQCEAAWQSAQSNPLIVGWEIRLSNNHTTLRDGKPCPFHDMCDELQGVYPKAFRFRGWHPHCRCEMLPIIARPSDRKELYRRIFKGDAKEHASWSPRAVEEVPQVFTDWVEKNRARARGWRTLPRFITDNPAYIVGEYGRPKPRPVEVPPGFLDFEDPRKPKKTEAQKADIQSRWNTRVSTNRHGTALNAIAKDFSDVPSIALLGGKVSGRIAAGVDPSEVDVLMAHLRHKIEVKKAWEERALSFPLNVRRKMLYKLARQKLVEKTVIRPEIRYPIEFTGKGIKEVLDQPHDYVRERNEAILKVVQLIQEAEYIGNRHDYKGRELMFYYFKTEIAGHPSYIVIKEDLNMKKAALYSITDKIRSEKKRE